MQCPMTIEPVKSDLIAATAVVTSAGVVAAGRVIRVMNVAMIRGLFAWKVLLRVQRRCTA